MNLSTDDELADLLGITVDDVRDGCRRKGWPCVRPKRTIWRFTDEQIQQIVLMQTRNSSRRPVVTAGSGQTSRSKGRSA